MISAIYAWEYIFLSSGWNVCKRIFARPGIILRSLSTASSSYKTPKHEEQIQFQFKLKANQDELRGTFDEWRGSIHAGESSWKLVTRKADEGQSTREECKLGTITRKGSSDISRISTTRFRLKNWRTSPFAYGINGKSDPNSRKPVVTI